MSKTTQASPGDEPSRTGHGFGTAPLFLASISTILGAILFLRFGYAVGHVGQIMPQKNRTGQQEGWRPSFIALTRHGERRVAQFDLLVRRSDLSRAGTFVDTLISPSFETAVTQALQFPGISGFPNNSVLLEFDQEHPEEIADVGRALSLAASSRFNVVVLRSTTFRFGYRSSIHIWVTPETLPNAAMMLMLAYIIVGHPEWRTAEIRVFACVGAGQGKSGADELTALIDQGRLPISSKNIETLSVTSRAGIEAEVAYRSSSADPVIAGISSEQIEEGNYSDTLQSHAAVNDMLFVHATERIEID